MGKYLTKFDTQSEYETYIGGQNAILPNVSYCEDQKGVHYNPYVPIPRLTKMFVRTNEGGYTYIVDEEGKVLVGNYNNEEFVCVDQMISETEGGMVIDSLSLDNSTSAIDYEWAIERWGANRNTQIIPSGDKAFGVYFINGEISYNGETAHLVNGHFQEDIPNYE